MHPAECIRRQLCVADTVLTHIADTQLEVFPARTMRCIATGSVHVTPYLEHSVHVLPIDVIANMAYAAYCHPHPGCSYHKIATPSQLPALLARRVRCQLLQQTWVLCRWQLLKWYHHIYTEVGQAYDVVGLGPYHSFLDDTIPISAASCWTRGMAGPSGPNKPVQTLTADLQLMLW